MLAGNIGLASVIDIVTMPEPAVVPELSPPSEHDRVPYGHFRLVEFKRYPSRGSGSTTVRLQTRAMDRHSRTSCSRSS
jgi:hypothetical protein